MTDLCNENQTSAISAKGKEKDEKMLSALVYAEYNMGSLPEIWRIMFDCTVCSQYNSVTNMVHINTSV